MEPKPFLEIREQPSQIFDFRYHSENSGESKGPRGTIKGTSSGSFPTVVLHNYNYPAEVVIKCSLYQKYEDADQNDQEWMLLPHELIDCENNYDPHYIRVSENTNYTAVFKKFGIFQIKKDDMVKMLINKMKKEKEFEECRVLSAVEIGAIEVKATQSKSKAIDINQVNFGFTAYMKDVSNKWTKITDTVYSMPMRNKKAPNGKLSIVRMSACKGEAQGGTEIFMFVSKVDKNTIKVRFYETADNDAKGNVVWESNGIFSPSDVHYQYGIVLKSPPYRNQQIERGKEIKVFVQLYCESFQSEGVEFFYKPNRIENRKQPKLDSTYHASKLTSVSEEICLHQQTHFEPNTSTIVQEPNIEAIALDTLPNLTDEFLNEEWDIENRKLIYPNYTNPQSFNKPVQDFLSFSGNISMNLGFNYPNEASSSPFSTINFTDLNGHAQNSSPYQSNDYQQQNFASPTASTSSAYQQDLLGYQGDFLEIYQQPNKNLIRNAFERSAMLEKDSTAFKSGPNLTINEKMFEVLAKMTKDQSSFADLVENGSTKDIETFTLLILKYNLKNALLSTNDLDQNVLHLSILNGQCTMAKVFLKIGVDINQADSFGNTPLHQCVISDCAGCLKNMLALENVEIDNMNDKGETPLSLSVAKNNLNFAKMLIAKGASVSKINSTNGFNSLHVAVNTRNHSLEMIKYLIEVDHSLLSRESHNGKTPLQLAVANHLPDEIILCLSNEQKDEEDLEMDEICMTKLCEIFDSKNNWKIWTAVMGIEDKIEEWENLDSPSKALFEYLKTSKKSLDDLIGLLDLLNDAERLRAMDIIDEMLARKFDK